MRSTDMGVGDSKRPVVSFPIERESDREAMEALQDVGEFSDGQGTATHVIRLRGFVES